MLASSDYNTQRKYRENAAAASERYRDRKAAEERTERTHKLKIKKQTRKKEADALRKASLKLTAEQAKPHPQATSSSKKSPRSSSATNALKRRVCNVLPSSYILRFLELAHDKVC
ncbi:hypothetical protein C8F04DRAFT_1252604 [Mycena alexandri]|uniref:Uncharacterized protein n=1 Tax=Mycena alexandri TaxID=1745969 RepID=A0AAD6TC64_9AGAR|nr:hypothetical protein C8F04DRAFT_1252604 [Mycena alexandri]